MTASARFLLRRALAAARRISDVAANATKITATTTSTTRALVPTRRFCSVSAKSIVAPGNSSSALPSADVQKYENLVEESIKKLMTSNRDDAQEEQLKPISNEDLEVRLRYFQKVFEEAESCLSDLRETLFEVDDEQYLEECSCAEGSLNNAFTAYIDLLDDFRRSSEEQLQAYSEERNTNANNLKRLRKELDQIIEVANNRDRASG